MDSRKRIKLNKADQEKDVEVTFISNLYFKTHIINIIEKGNFIKGLAERSFTYLDKVNYKTISQVKNVILLLIYKCQNIDLENVHRSAGKSEVI